MIKSDKNRERHVKGFITLPLGMFLQKTWLTVDLVIGTFLVGLPSTCEENGEVRVFTKKQQTVSKSQFQKAKVCTKRK